MGRAKGSGIELDQRGALLVRLRDGKIVLHRPVHAPRGCARGRGTHRRGELAQRDRDDHGRIRGLEPARRRAGDADDGARREFVPIEQSIMQSFTGPEGMRYFFDASMEVWEEFLFMPAGIRADRRRRAGRARREGHGQRQRHRDRGALGARLHPARRAAGAVPGLPQYRRRRARLCPILSGHELQRHRRDEVRRHLRRRRRAPDRRRQAHGARARGGQLGRGRAVGARRHHGPAGRDGARDLARAAPARDGHAAVDRRAHLVRAVRDGAQRPGHARRSRCPARRPGS